MDDRLSPSRSALLAVCCATVGLLALTEQFAALLVAVPVFLAAGWVFRWEQWPTVSGSRTEVVGSSRG